MQKKKTLEERLAACGSGGHRYPEAFWLDTCGYFQTLSDMRGDFYYSTIYNCMAVDESYGGIQDSFLAEAVSDALFGQTSGLIRDEILCRILIEPFCDRKIWDKKGGNCT